MGVASVIAGGVDDRIQLRVRNIAHTTRKQFEMAQVRGIGAGALLADRSFVKNVRRLDTQPLVFLQFAPNQPKNGS